MTFYRLPLSGAPVSILAGRVGLITALTVDSVAYAENLHGGDSFRVIWWSFVFGVRSL